MAALTYVADDYGRSWLRQQMSVLSRRFVSYLLLINLLCDLISFGRTAIWYLGKLMAHFLLVLRYRLQPTFHVVVAVTPFAVNFRTCRSSFMAYLFAIEIL